MFHEKYCNKEVTERLNIDLKAFIFYWTYGGGGKDMGLSKAQVAALERARNTILKYTFMDSR